MINNRIWLSSPHMGSSEIKYVNDAFASNWIAPLGQNVDNFENLISDYISDENHFHTIALSSGTSALHLALKMLNIDKGDIILIQSFTFCGTTNPASYLNAEIVFIDSELDTWNMCPIALETALKRYKNVKAIIPVHLYGMPAKMDDIEFLATKYNIPIIEDAAEALGSKFQNKYCGTFGTMSALSFNGNKIITTSGGGALISKDINYINYARFLSAQARNNKPYYEHSEVGYNYRMSNVLAGIGCGQMEVLNLRIQKRRENNFEYRNFFKNIPGITFQTELDDKFYSNYWLTSILIDEKINGGITNEFIRNSLEKENIESRPLWKPMHTQPVYNGCKFIGSGVCEKLFEQGLCLPSGSNLSKDDFQKIFYVLDKIFK